MNVSSPTTTMPSRRSTLYALLSTLCFLTGCRWLQPGITVISSEKTLPADGREHALAVLTGRHHLPLAPADIRLSGAPALRLDQTSSNRVTIYLRTPVQPSTLRITVRDDDHRIVLPVTLTPDNTDAFADGTPDWMRLHTEDDRLAFRRWFTTLAERAADLPSSKLPPDITDCAGLLRYCFREALRAHDDRFYAQFPADPAAPAPLPLDSVQQWSYPNTPLGAALFRTRAGPFHPADLTDGTFAQFADAKTLHADNTYLLGRDLHIARPGDLIFYRVLETDSQYHSMIITGEQGEWVVYHTGPIDGHPGEMRRVLLADLIHHPDPRWRPVPNNPNFLGVYRWNILREQ